MLLVRIQLGPIGIFNTKENEMTRQEVIELMNSSKTDKEWDDNCDKVKAAFEGYPEFWYQDVVMSGLAARVFDSW